MTTPKNVLEPLFHSRSWSTESFSTIIRYEEIVVLNANKSVAS